MSYKKLDAGLWDQDFHGIPDKGMNKRSARVNLIQHPGGPAVPSLVSEESAPEASKKDDPAMKCEDLPKMEVIDVQKDGAKVEDTVAVSEQCVDSKPENFTSIKEEEEEETAMMESPQSQTKTERQQTQQPTPLRRSRRDTNRIVLSPKLMGALQYRRMEQLFFEEDENSNINEDAKSSNNTNIRPKLPRKSKRLKQALTNEPLKTLRLGKFELQQRHQSPHIYTVDNFLTPNDLEFLHQAIASGQRKFQKSFVDRAAPDCEQVDTNGNNKQNINDSILDDTHRTSTFLSFVKQENAKVAAIEKRAAELLGYFSTDQIEPLQLVRYLPGQFFGVHHDMGDYNEDTGEVALPVKNVLTKRRLVTIFCYLNDLPSEAGGSTYFPACSDLRVRPKAGQAVIFCNVTPEGVPDARTIHAGEAVVDVRRDDATTMATTASSSCPEIKKKKGNNSKNKKAPPPIKHGLNIWVCER